MGKNSHMATWRAVHGPEQEVYFAQDPRPGYMAQSDFHAYGEPGHHAGRGGVWASALSSGAAVFECGSGAGLLQREFRGPGRGVGTEFVGTGRGAAAASDGPSGRGTAAALGGGAAGVSGAVSGAAGPLWDGGKRQYGREAHQNGDVEQGHFRSRRRSTRHCGCAAVATSRTGHYDQFLQQLVRRRNETRRVRIATELAALRPLPALPLSPMRELRVRVSRFSTIQVLGNTYSVPSRLLGVAVVVRVRAETLSVQVGTP